MDTNFTKAVSAYNNAANITLTQAAQSSINTDDASNSGSDFSGLLATALNSGKDTIAQSEKLSGQTLVKNANLANVVTAVSDANTALQTIVALRDKMVDAYQDVIKMTV